MRIIQVNKFYYPRGGADQYFLDLAAWQAQAGHEVAVFSMHHPNNLETVWNKYFVSHLSFNNMTASDKWRVPGRVLYSLEAKRKFIRLLTDFKPDIIHCHNIYHHLSPSILDAARARNIPVIMHLHDYKLIAANHAMYAPGEPPHHCQPDNFWPCLRRACIKDSLSATVLGGLEMFLHHKILKIYERGVNMFIAPSAFMKDTAIHYGQTADKIEIVYNYYRPLSSSRPIKTASESDIKQSGSGAYLLYFGRLSPEKGLDSLIRAAAQSGHTLKIAGQGEAEANLRALTAKLQAPVEFLGFKAQSELHSLISSARAIVIPSIWGENMPLSLLEAMSLAKVVIAAKTGGLPEMIKHEKTGLLFLPGQVTDLVAKIKDLDRLDLNALGQRAKQRVADLRPEQHLQKIMALYEKLNQTKNRV